MPFSHQRLREIRQERDISREQLAVSVGRSYPSIHHYESGGTVPSIAVAERLAEALGVPVSDLFEEAA